jgi:hypothetical protein
VDVYFSAGALLRRRGVDAEGGGVSSGTRRRLHAASSAGALDVRRYRAAGQPSPVGLAGASGTVTTTELLLGGMMMHYSPSFSPRSSSTSTPRAGVRGWQPPRLLAGFGVAWARSMSSSAPAGQDRFAKDESGKRVRTNSNNVGGGGRGGGGMGAGGRGGGRGGGRRGGGRGGGKGSPAINSLISSAVRPEEILSVVTANRHELSKVNVSTAFNRLGKMAKLRDFSPRRLTADEGFQELLRLTRDFAENRKFDSQHVANTTHGIAKLQEAGRLGGLDGSVDDTLAALEIEAVRVAPKMKPQDLSNTVYAFSVLDRTPGDEAWAALEAAAARVAPEMRPQELANTVYAYAKLCWTEIGLLRTESPQLMAFDVWESFAAQIVVTPGIAHT